MSCIPSSHAERRATRLGMVLASCLLARGLAAPDEPAAGSGPTVRWQSDPANPQSAHVELAGLDTKTWQRVQKLDAGALRAVFPVYAEQGDPMLDVGVPPMAGSYLATNAVLRFTPRFPLETGVRYRAVFKPAEELSAADRLVAKTFELPAPAPARETVVTRVHPGADELPENLLKFYVHFSQSMSRGHSYNFVQLLRDTGEPVELPFLELDEELWDPAMTRFTLLIDPGRIKTGVQPLEEIGPALEEGRHYTLRILRHWRDARGQPLAADFEKSFRVVAPDRTPPDPEHWSITAPAAGTVEQVGVRFDDSLDHALALRLITVIDARGNLVHGEPALSDDETHWTFTPGSAWRPMTYRLVVETTIEDLAGNNIGKPFEVDLFERIEREPGRSRVELPFAVGPATSRDAP